MSEIEKMYENAGCKKILCDCTNCKKTDCTGNVDQDTCVNLTYSLFTAEKQLLLIQWLAETRPVHITFLLGKWTIEGMIRYGIKYDTFEDALSGYVNQIWEDLKPEEKQQVKGILE